MYNYSFSKKDLYILHAALCSRINFLNEFIPTITDSKLKEEYDIELKETQILLSRLF